MVENNILELHRDYPDFALVSIVYGNEIYIINWNKILQEASLWSESPTFRKLEQDDMNSIADICYEFFSSL